MYLDVANSVLVRLFRPLVFSPLILLSLVGCIPTGGSYSGLDSATVEEGVTTRAEISQTPFANSPDGRFAAYRYHGHVDTIELTGKIPIIPKTSKYTSSGRVLLEFDDRDRVVQVNSTSCSRTLDFSTGTWGPSIGCSAGLLDLLEIHYGDDLANEYKRFMAEPVKFLEERARSGDSKAAYALYERLSDDPRKSKEAMAWLSEAAGIGHKDAQLEMERIAKMTPVLESRAKEGDSRAAAEFAKLTGNDKYLEKIAADGNLDAAVDFAKLTGNREHLEKMAEAGNWNAAVKLALLFDDETYAVRYRSKRYDLSLTEKDQEEAYKLFQKWKYTNDFSQLVAAWSSLCKSANAGYQKAQSEIANWHLRGYRFALPSKLLKMLTQIGVHEDNRIAYMWLTLAASTDYSVSKRRRDASLVNEMTPDEIAQAEQMVLSWKPGDCPSAEHRLGVPGET